jgi:hypothetical protein
MGLLLIFLGLLTAGVVADFVMENHLLTAPNDTVLLFGTTITVSGAAPIVAAFIAGVITLLLIVFGIGLLRGSWGRRRALKHRIAELEWQNTELRSRERLQEVVDATHAQSIVQVPESEAQPEAVPETAPAVPATATEEIGATN